METRLSCQEKATIFIETVDAFVASVHARVELMHALRHARQCGRGQLEYARILHGNPLATMATVRDAAVNPRLFSTS